VNRGAWAAEGELRAVDRGQWFGVEKEREMVATDRRLLRKKLDREMRYYRLAGREKDPTNGLLRAVREALRIPFKEISERMGVERSGLIGLEGREETGSITLRSLGRMAEAMGCKVVYGLVPLNGKTLEELAEERLWKSVLGDKGGESESASQQVSGDSEAAEKQAA
jgi:predicted DNA-binding mobile mystery protein A